MTTSSPAMNRPFFTTGHLLGLVQDAALIAVAGLFVFVHGQKVLEGNWFNLPFALQQTVLLFLFLTRRRSRMTSNRVQDWIFATLGAWGPLAFQVHSSGADWMLYSGFALQAFGAGMAIFGISWLGRSFGVVAANRGLKTSGPYGIVRHPVYACHLITDAGFILANFHWINFVLVGVVVIAQVFRMRAEERVLTASAEYAEYKKQVPYRLVPGVY